MGHNLEPPSFDPSASKRSNCYSSTTTIAAESSYSRGATTIVPTARSSFHEDRINKPFGKDCQSHFSIITTDGESEQDNDWPLRCSDSDSDVKQSYWNRVKNAFQSQISLQSIVHLVDFRPWFYPFTFRKYGFLFLILCAIAGVVVSNHYFDWIEKSLRVTRSNIFPILIITVCGEPLITILILLVAHVPNLPKDEIALVMGQDLEEPELYFTEKLRCASHCFDTALVIPCHDTDLTAIRRTIDSALLHFRPQDIIIVDNGKTRYPTHPVCNFRSYIERIHSDIMYIWSPLGSKNAAQLVGALAAKEYKYIMTVDDDVCIPKNFRPPVELIDDKFKAVAYGIKAIDQDGNTPLWLTAWQDVEYRLSGMSKSAEDRLSGVLFPHGAGWFVERESFIELLQDYHPMDFIAEDCNAGIGLNRMGKGIRYDGKCFLATEAPTTFFGPDLNWWKQRQKSWEMGRHGRLFAFIRQLFFGLPAKPTIQGFLWHKVTYLYLICAIVIDWIRIPTFIALGGTLTWWRNALLLMLFSAVPPLYFKYIKCRRRPDLQPKFWACVTYPWYKQIYVVVAILGAIRAVCYYAGGHPRPPTIKQMVKRKDERCFWLDPRFETNPSWLADEYDENESEHDAISFIVKHTQPYRKRFVSTSERSLKQPNHPQKLYRSPLIRPKISTPFELPIDSSETLWPLGSDTNLAQVDPRAI